MKGEFGDGYQVFQDMFGAMADLANRQSRGVGLQNFRYGASLLEFANLAAIVSPELYRMTAKQLQLPDIRTLKYAPSFG